MAKNDRKGLTSAIQEGLVGLVCYGSPQDARAVLALVPSGMFSPYYKELVKKAEEYLTKYGKTSGEHTWDLFEELANLSPDKKTQFRHVYDSIQEVKADINREYILGKAKVFARKQNQLAIFQKALPLLNKDDEESVDALDAILAGSTKQSIDLSAPGILFNDPSQALRFLNKDVGEIIPMGIPDLDRNGACPARKKYLLIVAETSTGKSWAAVHIGKSAMMNGFRTLHVTLEMSEDEVSQRYVQMFCSVGKREANAVLTRFGKGENGKINEFIKNRVKRPTLEDKGIASKLEKHLRPLKGKPRLHIQEFPSGMLTMNRLKSFLDYFEAVKGVIFDCMIVDYPDLMEHDSKNKRNELEKIAVDLRGIAAARNMAVVGLSQVNESKTGKVIKTGRAHEGRAKEHTADIILSLNQTEDEYEMGFIRIHTAKVRGDKKSFTVLVSQALGIGQFCVDSCLMVDKTYWNLLEEKGTGEQ